MVDFTNILNSKSLRYTSVECGKLVHNVFQSFYDGRRDIGAVSSEESAEQIVSSSYLAKFLIELIQKNSWNFSKATTNKELKHHQLC